MKRFFLWWRGLLTKNAFAWTALSFLLIYVAFVVLQGDTWIRIWLKGDSYLTYQLVFVPAILVGYGTFLARSKTPRGVLASAAIGCAWGYLSGLVAYFAVALAMPEGADRIVRNLSRFSLLDFTMLLILPTILLNWLLGMLLGVMTAFARRSRK